MSMFLTALPPELISQVVANIESLPALCNLARCSHQLYLCTIPHLYHHVKIEEGSRRGVQGYGQLRNLASLLIRRPDLAGLVRHFTLHVVRTSEIRVESSEGLEESEEQFIFETLKVDQASETADNASSLCKYEELSRTPKCHHDLILALLLPALLKVEKLALDLSLGKDYQFLERMIRRAAHRDRSLDIQPMFQALTVFAYVHGRSLPRSTDFIASLLKLPVLQEIAGGFGQSRVRLTDKKLRESNRPSSPLTSLDLASYAMWPSDLGHILRAPKALKTFFYKVYPHAYISLKDVRHALEPQANCLESLGLDFGEQWYDGNYEGAVWETLGSITSFMSFNKLKVIKIPAHFLDTTIDGCELDNLINIFPPNLETLHLTRFQACLDGSLEAMEHLVAEKSPQQIPSLKKVIVEGIRLPIDEEWRSGQDHPIVGLSRVAVAQGVSVEDRLEIISGYR